MEEKETIQLNDIVTDSRIRGDLGDIDGLASSIREFGLIQPIVIAIEDCTIEEDLKARGESLGSSEVNVLRPTRLRLIAGGRRFTAIKRLGWKELIHAKHFIWREEEVVSDEIRLKMQAIEIEENVRRKDLTWQEQVLGKRRLLEIMQRIHGGASKTGAPTRAEKYHGEVRGFGINKLAAMLGESAGKVSQDVQLGNAIAKIPQLANADSKESARRKLNTLGTIISMKKESALNVQSVNTSGAAPPARMWELYEGKFNTLVHNVPSETVDLVYSDLPFGVDLSKMSKHDTGAIGYQDDRALVVNDLDIVAAEAFRILREDRFAVFWFGFNYYSELLSALQVAGFKVNAVPFVWFKNSRSTENPNQRYGNSYDPAIVAMKGSPMFIRPGAQNWFAFPQPVGQAKLQIAQQPVELVTRFLGDMVVSGAMVCDLTAGSGTTGVAAVKFGCKAIMFEKEPEAWEIIKARMGVLK